MTLTVMKNMAPTARMLFVFLSMDHLAQLQLEILSFAAAITACSVLRLAPAASQPAQQRCLKMGSPS